MTNWITSQIEFEASSKEEARQIYEVICVDNRFDFRTLAPPPLQAYCDDFDKKEEIKRSAMEKMSYEWNSARWFYEYKTCEISGLEFLGRSAAFKFHTARAVPYPVVEAFGDKFKVPFTLKYCDESYDQWGIESYDIDENGMIQQTYERLCFQEDLDDLYLELIGYEPEQDD